MSVTRNGKKDETFRNKRRTPGCRLETLLLQVRGSKKGKKTIGASQKKREGRGSVEAEILLMVKSATKGPKVIKAPVPFVPNAHKPTTVNGGNHGARYTSTDRTRWKSYQRS